MTREQKKNDAKDAQRIRGIVHESDKNKRTNHVHDEMVITHASRCAGTAQAYGKDGRHWDDQKDREA